MSDHGEPELNEMLNRFRRITFISTYTGKPSLIVMDTLTTNYTIIPLIENQESYEKAKIEIEEILTNTLDLEDVREQNEFLLNYLQKIDPKELFDRLLELEALTEREEYNEEESRNSKLIRGLENGFADRYKDLLTKDEVAKTLKELDKEKKRYQYMLLKAKNFVELSSNNNEELRTWATELLEAMQSALIMVECQMEIILGFIDTQKRGRKTKGRPTKKDGARRFIPRLATITNKEYACALSPNIGGPAYIAVLDEEFFKQTGFNEADGALIVKDRPDIKIPLQDLRTKEDIKSLDYTLLRSIYTLIYQQKEKPLSPGTYVINEMELARFLGIQINKGNAYPLLAKINQFNSVAGVINGSIYALLHLNSYDKDTGEITLYSGFMGILNKAIKLSSTRTKKTKGIQETYENPSHGFLMHSNVGAKCKNVNGILLAEKIITLIFQTGMKGKPHFKFSTLIDSVPTLKQTLDETPLRQNKNNTLKRAFTAAYKVLKNNTDVYGYFKNLNIPEVIPTMSVLDTVIDITHEGLKKGYKAPPSI